MHSSRALLILFVFFPRRVPLLKIDFTFLFLLSISGDAPFVFFVNRIAICHSRESRNSSADDVCLSAFDPVRRFRMIKYIDGDRVHDYRKRALLNSRKNPSRAFHRPCTQSREFSLRDPLWNGRRAFLSQSQSPRRSFPASGALRYFEGIGADRLDDFGE